MTQNGKMVACLTVAATHVMEPTLILTLLVKWSSW